MTKRTKGAEELEKALAKVKAGDSKYVLKLYVAGITPKSTMALENVKRICDEYLAGRYELEVVDIYQQPKLAAGEQIIAVPTLVKKLPLPLRKMIGDMSDEEKFLVGLDLKPKES